MTRERTNTSPDSRRSRQPSAGERVRRRLASQPELELNDEELRALADEGIDPDDVRRLAREGGDDWLEASEHDRDTARDQLEGLTFETGADY